MAWRSISPLSEQAERIITAKVYVFSDSTFCQGEVVIQVQRTKLGRRQLNGAGRTTSSGI